MHWHDTLALWISAPLHKYIFLTRLSSSQVESITMAPPELSSLDAYLNSRKPEIYHRLYTLKNNVSQVHQWLCQYQEPWVTYV